MSDEDKIAHTLVIESTGEDGAWHIEHLPNCPKEQFTSNDFTGKHEPYEYYTCRVQAVLDGNGLDDIENWKELSPGEYKIKSYYEYYPGELGGSYGAEHEIGIFLVEESVQRSLP